MNVEGTKNKSSCETGTSDTNSTSRELRTRTLSSPMSCPTSSVGLDVRRFDNHARKNNSSSNKMDAIRSGHKSKTDTTDKKKSSRLEIYFDQVLGEGSFAKVYVGRYKGKLVAVKIVDIRNAKERHIRQFRRELDIIRILREHPHPNIPEYYKIVETKERIIIIMEWCRGGELSVLIKSGLDLLQVRYYFNQIISGYLHLLSLNIIHRDMKAPNIMLTNDLTRIKIIDFGLSKVISTDMTRTVVGSPAYMAPERLGAQDYDSTSDIWSLGIILYEMIYHVNPFKSCKNKAMLIKSASVPIDLPLIRHCNEIQGIDDSNVEKTIIRRTESVPDDILAMMSGMLNIDPTDRHDWDEIARLNESVMRLDMADTIRLEGIIEFYRQIRKNAISRSRANSEVSEQDEASETRDDNKGVHGNCSKRNQSQSRSDGSNSSDGSRSKFDSECSRGDDFEENALFNMDFDNDGDERRQRRRRNKKEESDICLDGSELPVQIRTQTDPSPTTSKAIPIPGRHNSNRYGHNRHRGPSPPYMAESVGNVAGASVEERELECLENYFLLNDPSIFSLYEEVDAPKPTPRRVKATDSDFVDISFLDSVPFLQEDFEETRGYDIIKSSSHISSLLYSRSAPVITGMSRLAKRAGQSLTNIISPPPGSKN